VCRCVLYVDVCVGVCGMLTCVCWVCVVYVDVGVCVGACVVC